ncbi:MAG: c-type cytochrome [Sphingomonas sp.]
MFKIIAASLAALAASSFAILVHAAPVAGLRVDFTSPVDRSNVAWNAQAPYAVTAVHDGKSTKYGELPAKNVVVRATYVADTAKVGAPAPLDEGIVQISQSNCMGCHDFAASSSGPSFAAIAKRYTGRADAAAMLAGHIRSGSSGAWGGGAMPPHPDLSPAQAMAIGRWIVAAGNDPAVHYSIGTSGSFRMTAPGKPGPHAGLVLSAFYTGPLDAGETRAASGRNIIVVSGS